MVNYFIASTAANKQSPAAQAIHNAPHNILKGRLFSSIKAALAGALAIGLAGCANYGDLHSDSTPRKVDSFATSET
ncbi:MAG TPA: hypothetical protein VLC91_02970, partial [Spongiibacteraceae bacterium]|nr:hypothetical protein [Spongiibacteraceae bacterium]